MDFNKKCKNVSGSCFVWCRGLGYAVRQDWIHVIDDSHEGIIGFGFTGSSSDNERTLIRPIKYCPFCGTDLKEEYRKHNQMQQDIYTRV